jgi:hypothetical protein
MKVARIAGESAALAGVARCGGVQVGNAIHT